MPTLKQLEDQGRELALKQLAVVNDDERPWSDRQDEFDKIGKDITAVLDQHKALKGVESVESYLAGGAEEQGVTPGTERRESRKSIGEQIIESDEWKAIAGKKGSGSRFTSGAIEIKDLTVSQPTQPGVMESTRLPGVVDIRFRRLTVRDLLAQGSMDNPAVSYLVETVATNAADAVAAGGLKPESALTLATVIEAAKKIATTLTTEDEILDDAAFARSYIDGRLRTFVELKEEDELLNGSGSGAHLTGLMNRSGLAAAVAMGADTRFDAIFKQITAIRTTAFLDPDGIAINPADWQEFKLAKDANGQYYGGGPFAAGVGDFLWGLPVAVTPAIAAGTALVGAYGSAAQFLERRGLTVEATNTNEDDFTHNRVTFRAEKRGALAVYRPGAFGKVTGI
jgi:HK97 family phage major capsid protein